MALILHSRVESVDDSDVTVLTCPPDKMVEVMHVHVDYTSNGTVGSRCVNLEVLDKDLAMVTSVHAGATQPASASNSYLFARGVTRETSFNNNQLVIPIPFGLMLLAGWSIRIYDSAEIDPTADDLTVNMVCRVLANTKADYIT